MALLRVIAEILYDFNKIKATHIRQFILLLYITLIPAYAFSQQERKPIRQGNKLYYQQKYDEAEKKYDRALQIKPNLTEGLYNKGNVLYQKQDYENAKNQFETAAALATHPQIKAKAYHNLGNAFLEQKKYKESVEAYKNALKLNPNDIDTKYNLAYALQMLKQHPQQNQQQQNKDKNQDKNNQQQQNQEQSSQNNSGNKNEQEQKESSQNQQQQANKPEENKEKPQPRQAQISKAEADKLLEALQQEEQKVQEKLQKNKGTPVKVKVEKDW
jgi:tetratricopeptide (TPR) repeat protein